VYRIVLYSSESHGFTLSFFSEIDILRFYSTVLAMLLCPMRKGVQAHGTKPGILYIQNFSNYAIQYTGCHIWDLVHNKKNLYTDRAIGELVEAGLGLHFVELGEIVDHREDDNRHDVEGAAAHLQKLV
jgi:hypothetical protein